MSVVWQLSAASHAVTALEYATPLVPLSGNRSAAAKVFVVEFDSASLIQVPSANAVPASPCNVDVLE